jgi:hypothetical protein
LPMSNTTLRKLHQRFRGPGFVDQGFSAHAR